MTPDNLLLDICKGIHRIEPDGKFVLDLGNVPMEEVKRMGRELEDVGIAGHFVLIYGSLKLYELNPDNRYIVKVPNAGPNVARSVDVCFKNLGFQVAVVEEGVGIFEITGKKREQATAVHDNGQSSESV